MTLFVKECDSIPPYQEKVFSVAKSNSGVSPAKPAAAHLAWPLETDCPAAGVPRRAVGAGVGGALHTHIEGHRPDPQEATVGFCLQFGN